MTVLHLLKTGAGATWALRQIAALRNAGIDVVVAMPTRGSTRVADYRRLGVEVVDADLDFSARRPWKLPAAIARCRELVARVAPDLVHSHFVSTTVVARLALGRSDPRPRIFQVPGILHLEHAPFRTLDLATSGPADHWVATCCWTRDTYRRLGVAPERVSLSYYGTELTPFRTAPPGALRPALSLGAEDALVGLVAWMYAPKWFLGQMHGIKGHEDFLAAIPRVRAPRGRAVGVVVGGAWAGAARYERRLRRRAATTRGAIVFTGPRDDVPAVYRDLDVAVHPSRSENCGGAVESLAAACPTVATAVGGLPDVVRDGETGWLVSPGDRQALAAAVSDVLRHPEEARRRALRGRELVAELFDVGRTAREIARLYERLVPRIGSGAVASEARGG